MRGFLRLKAVALCVAVTAGACASVNDQTEEQGGEVSNGATGPGEKKPGEPGPADPNDPPKGGEDGASIATHTLPTTLIVGESVDVTVALANTGTTSWNRFDGYKLAVLSKLDTSMPGRIEMAAGVTTTKPEKYTFAFKLTAPPAKGTFDVSFQMVHENVGFFGPVVTQSVIVRDKADPPPPPPPPPPPDLLASFGVLKPNESRTSKNGTYTLIYQADGNLVLYHNPNTAIWDSKTNGTSKGETIMQGDGNLVVYNGAGTAVWSSGTVGYPGGYLRVQDDGDVVIFSEAKVPIWRTFTAGK